ncbi:hypothetical protein LUZ62_074158 [Rhynchospora pubera]|uniref:Uncharacterized protein n=1 Tax=Rhynchospora pubera TaxID=906938 RepID=A0AAV8D4N1_9POAL|nr:hypothetical protein LUZ62_074158 [Rhynchospora pubera]
MWSPGRYDGKSRREKMTTVINESIAVCTSSFHMGWLQSLFTPLKKLWFRVHSINKKKRGIYILYEDVKKCQCEDVHILWSILVESHPPALRLKQ